MINRSTHSKLLLYHFLIALFIGVLPGFGVQAQGNYMEGYVISPSGDTLKGFIKHRDLEKNPVLVNFSSSKKGSDSQNFNHQSVKEFYISEPNIRFKSRKIGVLDIKSDDEYTSMPSIVAKDSLIVYLKEVTTGPKATLFVLTKPSGKQHYFLEKEGYLTELINYPFFRNVDGKMYLATYDEYRNQLPMLTSDAESSTQPVPSYNLKGLTKYVDNYNASFMDDKNPTLVKRSASGMLLDVNFNGGFEGWKTGEPSQKNEMVFGVGFRLSLPKKFHNRYIRLNFLFMPGETYYYQPTQKKTFKTIQAEIGTHFGSGKIRPFAGIGADVPLSYWKDGSFGPHVGISYLRQFNIEISNFANLYSISTKKSVLSQPRVSLNYYLNLNQLFRKK